MSLIQLKARRWTCDTLTVGSVVCWEDPVDSVGLQGG